MTNELEKWLLKFLHNKQQQGVDCKLIAYMKGKETKYMFQVNGELRNIENYLNQTESDHYKKLVSVKKSKLQTV